MPRVHIPTVSFGRWLLRRGIGLPVPLVGMKAARLGLAPLEINELAPDEFAPAGGDSAAQAERLGEAASHVVIAAEPFLREPEIVAFVGRVTSAGEELSAAGLIREGSALVLIDGPDQVQLEIVEASEMPRALVEVVPPFFGIPMSEVELSKDQLALLQTSGPRAQQAMDHVAERARADRESLEDLLRAQQDVQAMGMLIVVRADDPTQSRQAAADWFEGQAGALLKSPLPDGGFRFEPVDRPSLLATLSSQVASMK